MLDKDLGKWCEGRIKSVGSAGSEGDLLLRIAYIKFNDCVHRYSEIKGSIREHVPERMADRKLVKKKLLQDLKNINRGDKVLVAGVIVMVVETNDPMKLCMHNSDLGEKKYEHLSLIMDGQDLVVEKQRTSSRGASVDNVSEKPDKRKRGGASKTAENDKKNKKKKADEGAVVIARGGGTRVESVDESNVDESIVTNVEEDLPPIRRGTIKEDIVALQSEVTGIKAELKDIRKELSDIKSMQETHTTLIIDKLDAMYQKVENNSTNTIDMPFPNPPDPSTSTNNTKLIDDILYQSIHGPGGDMGNISIDQLTTTPPTPFQQQQMPIYTAMSLSANPLATPNQPITPAPTITQPTTPLLQGQQQQQIPIYTAVPLQTPPIAQPTSQQNPLNMPSTSVSRCRQENIMDSKWNTVRSSADSRGNFAWLIVLRLFTAEELRGKNCRGKCSTKGMSKGALDSSEKFTLLHDIVFHWWPLTATESKKEQWQRCITAIDCGLRRTINKNKPNAE